MAAGVNSQKKKNHETANYHRTQMQKEIVIQRLREQGCRITKQRLMLLDVILNEDCSCCKEIYYRAAEVDPGIGAATVYRMVNLLEEIGAISRKNMYRIACGAVCDREKACTIELDDDTIKELSAKSWNAVVYFCRSFIRKKIVYGTISPNDFRITGDTGKTNQQYPPLVGRRCHHPFHQPLP